VLAALVGVLAEGVAIAASPAGSDRWNEAAVGAVVLAYAVVGLVILWHRPGHPIGRIALAVSAVWGVGEALVAASYAVLPTSPDSRPAALASALGAFLSARMLGLRADGSLSGMENVAFVAIALTLLLPLFLFAVESSVRRRAAGPLIPAPELR